MGLKNKVPEQSERPQEQARQEELAFLKSIEEHVSTLQGAKFGADGLASIHLFLVQELSDYNDNADCERIDAGVEDICTLLAGCLRRETAAMEREVWDRKALLERKAALRRPARR